MEAPEDDICRSEPLCCQPCGWNIESEVRFRDRIVGCVNEVCTVNRTIRYLTKKWALLIIFELYKGDVYTRRFTELKDSPEGITAKVLSQRLKELEEEGLAGRRVDAEHFSVNSEYHLTEGGLGLIEV